MEQQRLKEKKNYETESIENLLLLLSYREEFPDEFSNSFLEFHRRYHEVIYKMCFKACRFFDNRTELATEIANNVLLLACENALDLDMPSNLKEIEKEALLKEWLVAIVKEELKRFTSHNPERKRSFSLDSLHGQESHDQFSTYVEENVTENGYSYPITIESVTEALSTLKPRDREIVLAYLTHVERKNAHLPDEIMEGLCKKYDTNSFNLRQIKKRAFDKIRKLSENNKKP